MVEDFEQDDFDMLDESAKRVLVVLSQFEKGLLVKVDFLHRKTALMPEGMNDAVRHLSKSKLIDILETPKRIGPYRVLRRRNHRSRTRSYRKIRLKLLQLQVSPSFNFFYKLIDWLHLYNKLQFYFKWNC